MSPWFWKAGLAGFAIVAAISYAVAQMGLEQTVPMRPMKSSEDSMRGPSTMHGQEGTHGAMGHQVMMGREVGAANQPIRIGQDAFETIQEIVQILEADPNTNWSKVNIAALREHLVDMDQVTLRAAINERSLDNGVEITVTGEGRTLAAIKRMVPAHAQELSGIGWNAKTSELADGVTLTVTSADPQQATKLRALGFMGIMVQGAHHHNHHLMIAKGEFKMH